VKKLFSFFKKHDAVPAVNFEKLLEEMAGAFNPLNLEILVVRKDCEVLYANARAALRFQTEEGNADKCKSGMGVSFPALCAHCPYGVMREGAVEGDFEVTDARGQTFRGNCKVVTWLDNEPAFIFIMQDISDVIEMDNRIRTLTYTDNLTGIPNRISLKEDFVKLEERILSGEATGVLALFDLDHFKLINDTYGHSTGDTVLRRLVEHLLTQHDFEGQLYRLGDDEFVLLQTHPAGTFESDDEMQLFYEKKLSNTLNTYSLPNIELGCTISIGVSLFPRDGSILSEILRKADIALLKAKSNGRNRIEIFASHYDTAQRLKDVYINILPILTPEESTFAYELIDVSDNEPEDDDSVNLKEFSRTLDALGVHNLSDKIFYFIAFTQRLLNPTVLANLPRKQFVVHINPPLHNDIGLYKKLKEHGYKLAVTNMDSNAIEPEIIELADYCMFSPKDGNLAKQRTIIAAHPSKKFIAVEVDTQAEYDLCKDAGFHYFKGFYFRHAPVEKKEKEINPLKVNYIRLMALSNAEDFMDFREISNIISSDVAMSYKLLRIISSAAVGVRNVTSISSAIAYMGEDNLKKWIAVLALRGAAEDKPIELIRMSLIRARFGELLAPHFRIRRSAQKLFMIGLLSLLHIALDTTREELMRRLPMEEDIRDSLMTKTGIYSDMLNFYENYEYSNWAMVTQFLAHHQLDTGYVNEAYLDSLKWYNNLLDEGG
jgi:EAL and modified HD-GYP domain-containing signal transduction protein